MPQDITDRITNDFSYHTPTPEMVPLFVGLRAEAKELAMLMVLWCPESRELSLALTNLEQAVFWANAGIARHGPNPGL